MLLTHAEKERFKEDLRIARKKRNFSPFHSSAIPPEILENAIHELSHTMALGLSLNNADATLIGATIDRLPYRERFQNEQLTCGIEIILLRALDVEEELIVQLLGNISLGQGTRFSIKQAFELAEAPGTFALAHQLLRELRELCSTNTWLWDHECVQIHTDGRTVWVNGPNGLLGRLGPVGIDVHADTGPSLSGLHCLDCGPLPEKPWEAFVVSMKEHHGVVVGDEWQPLWSKCPRVVSSPRSL